jgi:hypothetical protein
MSGTNKSKPKSANWLSLIDDNILGRVGTATPAGLETHGPGGGFSVCTERHLGNEPPDEAVTIIARIR